MARNQVGILPSQDRHGLVYANAGDLCRFISQVYGDCAEAETDGRLQLLAKYRSQAGHVSWAVRAGDKKDVVEIFNDGVEIIFTPTATTLKSEARCKINRWYSLWKDHSKCQAKIQPLFELLQVYFPEALCYPMAPDEDLQIQQAKVMIDLPEVIRSVAGKRQSYHVVSDDSGNILT